MARKAGSVTPILITHQPFRCRLGVPDWYFCFSTKDKKILRDMIDRRGEHFRDSFFGQLAGHQHRWWHGLAFDEDNWGSFLQWENSAVKVSSFSSISFVLGTIVNTLGAYSFLRWFGQGDVFDQHMSSSFTIFSVYNKTLSTATRLFQENGVWKNVSTNLR